MSVGQLPRLRATLREVDIALAKSAADAILTWQRLEDARTPEGQVMRVLSGMRPQSPAYTALCTYCGTLFRNEGNRAQHEQALQRRKYHKPGLGQPNVGLLVAVACRLLCTAGAPV